MPQQTEIYARTKLRTDLLVEHMVGLLNPMGWEVASEASFNIRAANRPTARA